MLTLCYQFFWMFRGPTFGSLGEIVSTSQVSYLSKFGVRFDNPIHGGLDLGGQCKAGYGFNCNGNLLCLSYICLTT